MNVAGIITGSGSIHASVDFKPIPPVTTDHVFYDRIREAFDKRDGKSLIELTRPSIAVAAAIHAADPTGKRATIVGRTVYYGGEPTDHIVSRRIIELLSKGFTDITYMLKFLENLMRNPSARARKEAYRWLEHHALPITPEGMMVG